MKQRLLEDLEEPKRLRFWAVNALLDHWGQESEVQKALRRVFDWSANDLARIADRLQDILADEPGRVSSILIDLVEAAATDPHVNINEIAEGLYKTGAFANDSALIDRILEIVARRHPDTYLTSGVVARILQLGPGNPKIEELARRSLRNGSGMIAVVALCFRGQPEMRRAVLEVAAPLPTQLRRVVAEGLRDRSVEDRWARTMLEEGQFDAEGGLAALCIVGAAHSRLASGTLDETFVAGLQREMDALGPAFERRRVAGFVALATAGELDRAISLLPEERGLRLSLSDWQLRGWADFDARLADIWVEASRKLEEVGVSGKFSLTDKEIIERLGAHVEGRPELRSIVDAAARRSMDEHDPPIAGLRYLLKDSANRPEILERCLPLLRDGQSWAELSYALDAAELVGHHFGGNALAHDRIVERFRRGYFAGPITALCNGWPESPLLEEVIETLRRDQGAYNHSLSNPEALKIVATKAKPASVVDNLALATAEMRGFIWDGIPYWSGTMQRRIREDEEVRRLMMAQLAHRPTPAEKVSFVGYLAAASGMGPELAQWCGETLEATAATPLAEIGMDIWLGHPVLVWKRLSDLLNSELLE